MHMIVAAALAALLAQTTPQPSAAPPAGTTPTTPTTTTKTAPVQGAPAAPGADFGELMSSLSNMRSEIARIQAMNGTSANNIKPVNVAQLSGTNTAALNDAITRNQAQLTQLRNTLGKVTITTSSNERITVAQFLADNKMTLGQVVGADVKNGTLVLFYQKP